MNKIAIWIIIVVVFIALIISYFVLFFEGGTTSNERVFCAQDVLHCPDGTYVSRVAPSCTFAACPNGSAYDSLNSATTTAKIGQKIIVSGIAITPLEIVSDSRCPVDVTCIQAGTVVVRVKIEGKDVAQTSTIALGKSLPFSSKSVRLVSVLPERRSQVTLSPGEYRFTFEVGN